MEVKFAIERTLDPTFKGGVLVTFDLAVFLNNKKEKKATYKVLEELVIVYPIVIFFRKNSHLVKAFDEKMRILKSAGIVGYWTDFYFQTKFLRMKDKPAGPKQMTIETLLGAFQLIFLGWCMSLLVFILEFANKKFKIFNILAIWIRQKNLPSLIFLLIFEKTQQTFNAKVRKFRTKI